MKYMQAENNYLFYYIAASMRKEIIQMPAYFDDQKRTWFTKFYYKDFTGKRKQKMKRGFVRKADALQYEREFLLRLAGSSDVTFNTLRESYIDYKRTRVKASTLRNLEYCLTGQIAPYFDEKAIRDISPADVLSWQNELINSDRKETTINKINSRLVDVFNYAVKYFGLPANPCIETIGTQKRNADNIDFWTLEEYRKFIDHVPDIEYRIIYELLFYSGMRIGELRALTLSDIDFDKNTIRIDKTLPRGANETTTPKTLNSFRSVSMPAPIMADLKKYTRHIYDLTRHNRLFFLEYQSITRYKNEVCRSCGVRQIRLHDLRHSHVSLLIHLDCDIMTIAERIGDTPATVQSTYAHLYPDKKDIAVSKLEKIVSK